MGLSERTRVAPPPPESASDKAKAAYYEKQDPADLLDAGYLEEDGIFEGDKRIADLRPERGLVAIPVDERVARKLRRVARRSGCTPSDLATRWLAESLEAQAQP
ncbi:MAG: hypothetical protein FJ290_08325 [Planctomycetes bacterium]|nr:hypothetical protein [Planctomycetota bacterium]